MNLSFRWLSSILILVLQLSGFFLFARGFFPKKLVLAGPGIFYNDDGNNSVVPSAEALTPQFDRVILMVIDALRSDFMFSANRSSMRNVHEFINSGVGIPFTAHSTPPTVTLPRIKGLTTGSTPNFLDAILNIAESDASSTLANQDSWVMQLKSRGKRLHMFGDDTWIKLFPGVFDKSDGTASFFVSDFIEVDNNVTRHIDEEISSGGIEWDVLILHYLGLDHIGHKGGPDSVFMAGKQTEMDHIIDRLYHSLDDRTLLVIAGDHGMNEAGNHGGSSSGETSAAMIFLSPKFSQLSAVTEVNAPLVSPTEGEFTYFSRIQQTDLVPSLAGLMNFPIPKNSLGVMLREFLPLWKNPLEQNAVLYQNIRQFMTILDSTYADFSTINAETEMLCQSEQDFVRLSDIEHLKCLWWKLSANDDLVGDNHDLAYDFLYRTQRILSRAASNYNDKDLIRGISLVGISTVISVGSVLFGLKFSAHLKFVILMIAGFYAASMFGSSLVEEEHHFWYWGATGWLSWLYITSSRRKFRDGANWVICLILIRIIRSWNQTGQKYAGGPDIAKWFAGQENNGGLGSQLVWPLILIHYGSLLGKLWLGSFSDLSSMTGFVASFCTIMSSLVFKINMAIQSGEYVPRYLQIIVVSADDSENLINLARLSFFTIGLATLYELSKMILSPKTTSRSSLSSSSLTDLSYVFEVLLVTQTRTYNIPIFIFFNLLRTYLERAFITNHRSSNDIVILITTFTLILQHVSFFAMGNSNSLASIDLSNAYNGIGSYQIFLVGMLTFISNWVGPLYWSAAGLTMLINCSEGQSSKGKKSSRAQILSTKILTAQMFFSIATLGVLGSCLILKHHLFIWTVFSPKLLYSAAWLVLEHVVIDNFMVLFLAFVIS